MILIKLFLNKLPLKVTYRQEPVFTVYTCMYIHVIYMVLTSEFLIHVSLKHGPNWLKNAQCVCHWEYILSPKFNAVSDNVIIINCVTGTKRELCSAK